MQKGSNNNRLISDVKWNGNHHFLVYFLYQNKNTLNLHLAIKPEGEIFWNHNITDGHFLCSKHFDHLCGVAIQFHNSNPQREFWTESHIDQDDNVLDAECGCNACQDPNNMGNFCIDYP